MRPDAWQPTRWWRVVRDIPEPGPGDIWCESSSEDECREALRTAPYPARLERFWERRIGTWRLAGALRRAGGRP